MRASDALTHAIESYLTIDSADYDRAGHPDPGYSGRSALTMLFARESIRLCASFLKRCYDDGADETARAAMCQASLYAALSYGSAGLNAVHGIAYAVAGLTHRSHGTTNAVMLPYVLGALAKTRRTELLDIAALFGVSAETDADATIARLCHTLRELIASLGIPTDLRSLGIEGGHARGGHARCTCRYAACQSLPGGRRCRRLRGYRAARMVG